MKIFHFIWQGNAQGNTINWKNSGSNSRIHPCQKPIELYEWILLNYAKKGDKILDTHLGSGSIALACNKLGFSLTACEIDEEYYLASIKKIKSSLNQIELFNK